MHRERLLTAAVAIPLLFAGLFWGGEFFFNCLMFLITVLCLYEYFSMSVSYPKVKIFGIVLGALPVITASYWKDPISIFFITSLIFFFSFSFILIFFKSIEQPFDLLAKMVFGTIYIGVSAGLIVLVRQMDKGLLWIFFLIMVIFSADTGAYYTGTTLGKHKLAPLISKGKTIEGTVGGLIASLVAAIIAKLFFLNQVHILPLMVLTLMLAIISQIGDLAESVIKRSCNVKDSGSLLPGHGGIFDRMDSLLPSGMALYWALYFLKGKFF